MTTMLAAACRQIAHLDDSPLDRIADAQANACTDLEARFIALLGDRDEDDARTLAALAITRLIEATAPEDLFAFLSPFDPLLR